MLHAAGAEFAEARQPLQKPIDLAGLTRGTVEFCTTRERWMDFCTGTGGRHRSPARSAIPDHGPRSRTDPERPGCLLAGELGRPQTQNGPEPKPRAALLVRQV